MNVLREALPLWEGVAEEAWLVVPPGRQGPVNALQDWLEFEAKSTLKVVPWLKVADLGRGEALFGWQFWEQLRDECVKYRTLGFPKIVFDFETAFTGHDGKSLWDTTLSVDQMDAWEAGTNALPRELAGVTNGGYGRYVMYPSHNWSRKYPSLQKNRETLTTLITRGPWAMVTAARCWSCPNDQWTDKWLLKDGLFRAEDCTQIVYVALDGEVQVSDSDSTKNWKLNGVQIPNLKTHVAKITGDSRFVGDGILIYPGATDFVGRSRRIIEVLR